jgi:enoyl-CoA hydratase/carnithine racemase
MKKWRDTDSEMCLKWRSLPKPTICAVQGYCIYHGCAVASSCDIIIVRLRLIQSCHSGAGRLYADQATVEC